MGTVSVVAFLFLIIIFAVRNSMKHFKGQGGCCGGSDEKAPKKVLKGKIIGSKVVYIEGMHCDNCKNSVEKSVNKIEGALCKVNLKKNFAVVSYDREIDENEIRDAIEKLDFTVVHIEEK